jgi:hypothetical protein
MIDPNNESGGQHMASCTISTTALVSEMLERSMAWEGVVGRATARGRLRNGIPVMKL